MCLFSEYYFRKFLSDNDYHCNLVDSFADRLKKERFPS